MEKPLRSEAILQVSPTRLFALNRFKQSFKVPFPETARTFALDNLKE
jgi:hypothetical protein